MEGLPEYDFTALNGDSDVGNWAYYYKYIFNVWLLAVPFTLLGAVCVAYNVYFNFEWNKMWASGNYWLIANTIYLVITYIIAVMEAFELPIFLRAFKVTRFLATFFSLVYIVTYFITVFEWFDMLYLI